MKVSHSEVFFASPGPGKAARAHAIYTRATGTEKLVLRSYMTRSDTKDWFERAFSSDNGKTWTEAREEPFTRETGEGVERCYPEPGFVDRVRDRYIEFSIHGILPNDDPLEGMKHWRLRYGVSSDGGRSFAHNAQMIQNGPYDGSHPFEGVYVGKNSMMLGDRTCRPIRTREGKIILPVQITPIGPDGEYHNPGGGYTYHYAAFVIGTWNTDDTLSWDISEGIKNDPNRSTRGAVEPTIAEFDDGTLLSVIRGSNDVRPVLPGYRWYAISRTGGKTWNPIAPWTFTDGKPFFSPSSCSQLFSHSNGNVYWVGNLIPTNPRGNRPRYPLVAGIVDPESHLLIRESLIVVDDRKPGESADMTLSSFLVDEDRETHELLVYLSRLHTKGQKDWTSDVVLHRIEA